MRVLLVNPPVIRVSEPWFDEPDFVRTALACLAGFLRKESGHEVHCIDAKFEKLTFEGLVNRAEELKPDLIGLTAFTNEIKPAAYVAGRLKKLFPNVPMVVGGPHVTAIPEQTLSEFPTFDIGVVGEGEQTLLELCNALAIKGSIKEVKGLIFRDGLKLVKTLPRPRILDQTELPMPAWDMLPSSPTYYIQTVRGCPLNCIFCMNHNGKVARKRQVGQVIDEMEYLIARGAKRISFGDELFSVDMERTEMLMDAMIANRVGQRVLWDIQTHVGYVNERLFRKMKEANIYRCEMGVEAGDEQSLKRMGTAINLEMIQTAFDLSKKYDITTGSFLLIGQPNETYSTIWKTIKLGIRINPTEPIIGTMVPYPGTEVARMAANGEGGYRMIGADWDDYTKQTGSALEFTYISKKKLEILQLFGYLAIFIGNWRILELSRFFWNYRIAAFNVVRNILLGSAPKDTGRRPKDYDKVINAQNRITTADFIQARVSWKNTQSSELQRAKELSPNLIKEQIPIRV